MSRVPKPLSEARTNLEQSIPNIQGRYEAGVNRADWVGAASSDQAETNYSQGVAEAVRTKSRAAGVRRAGNQGWLDGAVNKGALVIGQRIQDSLDKWETNFGRVYQHVERLVPTLPAKTRDANSNIDRRLKPVVQVMQANRIRGR
tara:strand:- start:4005 stop:4439 length:435 start_codon:yes stop_codon:yes gene_type:complete